jgi:putative ABC transport system substrate-binding protein
MFFASFSAIIDRWQSMRRRKFIELLVGATATACLSWSFVADAQQKMPRIGILLVRGPESMGPFREALRDLGYVEGRSIQIEVRSAEGQVSRLPELATELVRNQVDIIVASLTPAVTAAKNATRDIPIVMAPAGDPVGTGLIESLARPGGNITGLAGTGAELSSKNLELIREILPTARRVAVLGYASDPFSKPFLEQIQRGAQTTRFVIQPIMVGGNDELDGAFAAIVREQADAVIIQGTLPGSIADLALQHRLPTFAPLKSAVLAGALASYSASVVERGREIASYVDKILRGAKPADLPAQQPRMFELVVNLRTAKALRIEIPRTILERADEVID